MADVLHSAQTPSDGIHVQQKWSVANESARLALSVNSASIGGVCYQEDTRELFDLVRVTPSAVWQRRPTNAEIALIQPAAVASLHLYVAAAAGDDANDGLSTSTPKATIAAAYAAAAYVVKMQALPLVVIHLSSGTYAFPPMPFPLTILGDGAGQPGDTGSSVIATGASAAGTTAVQLVLGASVAVNAYRGRTLAWTTGPAAGYKSTIRDNTATVVTPVEAPGYPTTTLDPGVGSTYQILQPTVILQPTETSSVSTLCDGLGSSSRSARPAALVNVSLQGSSAAAQIIVSASNARFYGVSVVGVIYLIDASLDAGYALPFQGSDLWAQLVGLTGWAQLQRWNGWGVSWPTASSSERSLALSMSSLFRGSIVAGAINPSQYEAGQDLTASGTLEVHGGSFLGAVELYACRWIQGNANIRMTCLRMVASIQSEVQILGMTIDAGSTNAPLIIEWGCQFDVLGGLTVTGSNGTGMFVRRGARMFVRNFVNGLSVTGSVSGTGVILEENGSLEISNSIASFSGGVGALIVRGQSRFTAEAGTLTCTGSANPQPAIEVTEQSDFRIGVSCTLNAQGISGGLQCSKNSRASLEGATFTLAATSSGSGVVCNSGSRCSLSGGAGNTITGLGAGNFGVNCRGGGQAFFSAAPPATITGPGGDLTVGSGGGQTVAVSSLAASLSGVSDTLASVIMRSA